MTDTIDSNFIVLFTESHIFDDSDDEYEDDYTESLELIGDLNKKIEQKRKLNQTLLEPINVAVAAASPPPPSVAAATQVMQRKSNTFDNQIPIQYKVENLNKTPTSTQTTSNSAVRTRASNRLRNLPIESKISEASIIYDPNGQTIEVLMEDIGGGDEHGETEFIISDSIENAFEDPFQDSNDEEFEALIANSENQFENEQFSLQDVSKTEDLYISEESTDDNKNTDDDYDGAGKKKIIFI